MMAYQDIQSYDTDTAPVFIFTPMELMAPEISNISESVISCKVEPYDDPEADFQAKENRIENTFVHAILSDDHHARFRGWIPQPRMRYQRRSHPRWSVLRWRSNT